MLSNINTYIIDHYNPSVRIIDLVSHIGCSLTSDVIINALQRMNMGVLSILHILGFPQTLLTTDQGSWIKAISSPLSGR